MERITCEEGVSARYGGSSALIIAAVIVAAAFTSIPALAPAVNGSTEQPITVQRVSGTVEISIQWRH